MVTMYYDPNAPKKVLEIKTRQMEKEIKRKAKKDKLGKEIRGTRGK